MLTSNFPAVLDACVIYPAALRDTLLRAAAHDLYRVHWSADILDEVRRNLVDLDQRVTPEKWLHLAEQMTIAFPSASVTGYEPLIASMTNDPKDRHVAAAAVRVHAEVIVTANLKDFPDAALAPYGIRAKSPDEFLLDLTSINSKAMATILCEQLKMSQNKSPNATMDQLFGTLTKLGTPEFVDTIRAVISAIE